MAVVGTSKLNPVNDNHKNASKFSNHGALSILTIIIYSNNNNNSIVNTCDYNLSYCQIIVDRVMSSTSNKIINNQQEQLCDSDPDDSYIDTDPLRSELKNIQSVIHVTRQNIDALNNKFVSSFQPHPSSIYLTEYQELIGKLHELESKEQKLNALLKCPRTPLKSLLRAHLPNQQRTSVQVLNTSCPFNYV